MRSIKRITAAIAIICMVCNYNATIFANTKTVESSAGVISAPNELIVKLDEASIDLGNGLISEEEYNKKLIDIYNLSNSNDNMGSKVRKANSAYYPEVECGYIKYSYIPLTITDTFPSLPEHLFLHLKPSAVPAAFLYRL